MPPSSSESQKNNRPVSDRAALATGAAIMAVCGGGIIYTGVIEPSMREAGYDPVLACFTAGLLGVATLTVMIGNTLRNRYKIDKHENRSD